MARPSSSQKGGLQLGVERAQRSESRDGMGRRDVRRANLAEERLLPVVITAKG
jgi:hypothetical protein